MVREGWMVYCCPACVGQTVSSSTLLSLFLRAQLQKFCFISFFSSSSLLHFCFIKKKRKKAVKITFVSEGLFWYKLLEYKEVAHTLPQSDSLESLCLLLLCMESFLKQRDLIIVLFDSFFSLAL